LKSGSAVLVPYQEKGKWVFVPSKNRKEDVVQDQKTGSRSSHLSENRKQELAPIRKQEAGYSYQSSQSRKQEAGYTYQIRKHEAGSSYQIGKPKAE
jgi:hypothetical protein